MKPTIMPRYKWLIRYILSRGGVIHLQKCLLHTPWVGKWRYFIVDQQNRRTLQLTPTDAEAIEKLIANGDLISELSDKEFAIQLALGTVEHRVYNCK